MRLSLPQSLYLLCYTVEKEKFELWNLQGRGQLLRAGALTELAVNGQIRPDGKKPVRLPTEPPADSFLAEVWQDVPDEKPKGLLGLVHNKAHRAEKPVREQLSALGAVALRREKRLGLLNVDRVTVNDPQQVSGLQARVREAATGGGDPAALPVDELAMAVFAAEVEVTSVFTGKERDRYKQEFKSLAARFDEIVPDLRGVLRDSYLSSRAVGGGWAAGT